MSPDKCPNCGKALRGFFVTNDLLLQSKVDFINKHTGRSTEVYCDSCAQPFLNSIGKQFQKEKEGIENRLKQIIHFIPVISCPAPNKWNYEVIGLVSAQTTSGTGFLSEFSQSINDFFGTASNTTNQKINRATNLCKADLRLQCVRSGGNVVISTDIDFSEVGTGNTNMLMVCMAGTAIRVIDMESFDVRYKDTIIEVVELSEQLEAIRELQAEKTALK